MSPVPNHRLEVTPPAMKMLVMSVPSDAQPEALSLSHSGGRTPGQLDDTSGRLGPTMTS